MSGYTYIYYIQIYTHSLITIFYCFCSYNELFFMVDTCQAASLYEKFTSPNVLAVASSLVGEDSLSVSVTSTQVKVLIRKN